ncbi:MAG: hypothetical protein HYR51_07625 [Candidatus Rokubacteria bacterium]|nr:hypothetical protein [Candidatus Rokubacteria bacterium]
MTIDIDGLRARSTLRAFITRKIAAMFSGVTTRPLAVRVGFVDENGPKGGVAIRCGINVDLPRRPPIHIEERAATERLAFDGALDALQHRMERQRGKLRAERRRPKKYFLAKRLLMPDETLDKLETRARPSRRAVYRKSA